LDTKLNQKIAAPFGSWPSPIDAGMVARAGTSLSGAWLAGGTAWWLEGRPSEGGRVVVMKADAGEEPVDVTPAGFNVRSMAHEYGGGAYTVHDGTVFFSNFDDQRLYRQDPGAAPVPITPEIAGRRHRYADGRVTQDGSLWIGVRERHEGSGRPD
jgi:sugar lactone lactonase YvrE